MASVFYGGEAELNLFTAGEPHPSMMQYVREQAQVINSYIQRTGNQFAQGVVDAYQTFYSDEAIHRARVGISRVKSYFQEDRVVALTSIYDIQQASPVMQRYIMAEPTLAKMYDQGRCEGYGMANPFPNQYGEDNYNYRRVMNGMIQTAPSDEDHKDGSWKVEIYIEELMEGDRELILPEQTAIGHTWKTVRYSLANSMHDPSSKTGEML
jgi:hypothetical protein